MLEIYRTVTENPGGVTRVTDSTDSIERDKDELSLMSEVGQRSGYIDLVCRGGLQYWRRNRLALSSRFLGLESNSRGINMNNLDKMLERNKDFAAQQSAAGTLMPSLPRAMANVKAIIIGCADMRADPAHVLGIKPGEAVVVRNIGGRITPGLLEQLGLLGRIGQVVGEIPGGGGEFHIIVLQHTDCGMARLAGDPAMLTHYFQIQEAELKAKAVTDPRAAVAVDAASLRAIPALPGEWLVSGLVYDVATGLVEIVVPPAPIRTA